MIQKIHITEITKAFHNVEVVKYPNELLNNIKQFMKTHKKLPFNLTMRTRWHIFKGRLKSLTMKKLEIKGAAKIRFENGVPVQIERKDNCICRRTFYLFKIPIYQTSKAMTDKEIISLFKES